MKGWFFPGETEAMTVSAEQKPWKQIFNLKSRIYHSYVKIKYRKYNDVLKITKSKSNFQNLQKKFHVK